MTDIHGNLRVDHHWPFDDVPQAEPVYYMDGSPHDGGRVFRGPIQERQSVHVAVKLEAYPDTITEEFGFNLGESSD